MSIKKYMLIAFSIKGILLIFSIIIVYTVQSAITLNSSHEWLFNPLTTIGDYKEKLTQAEKDNQADELLALKNERGQTPLLYAIDYDDLERVKLILSFGADPNARDTGLYEGTSANTPLHRAIYHGDSTNTVPIIDALLQAGANPRLANDHGSTPLHLTGWITNSTDTENIGAPQIHVGRRMTAILLLTNAGADLNAQDDLGKTLLHLLVDKRDTNFIEKLILQFPLTLNREIKNKAGLTPLEYAKWLFEPQPDDLIASLTLKAPAPQKTVLPTAQAYDQGVTPLMIGIIKNDKPVIDSLLSTAQEADLQALSQNGNTPLHYAVLSPDPVTLVPLLLAKKANSHSVNKQGNSPLHLVALIADAATRYKVFQLLMQAGSNLASQNNNGDTLLHLAVKNKDKELVSLITKQFTMVTKNHEGATPYDLAQKFGDDDIAKIIEPYIKIKQ